MKYILVDFEWNRPTDDRHVIDTPIDFESEIIEIGAVKLDEEFNCLDEFQSFVKPQFYSVMNGEVASLTKIRVNLLDKALGFQDVFNSFRDWCEDDYCLCTWGDHDIPVLLDNMIMHDMPIPNDMIWCNLQRVFSYEIMREPVGRKWALDKAIDYLGLPKHRAHDALNDARNTRAICERVSLMEYLEEYISNYIHYDHDRRHGFSYGKEYTSLSDVQNDSELMDFVCPCCSGNVSLNELVQSAFSGLLSYGQCECGHDYLVRFSRRRLLNGSFFVRRAILKMNGVLWDDYQDALEYNDKLYSIAG